MAKQRIKPGERLKSTMVEAFRLWRPFETEFRQQVEMIQAKTIELAEITAGGEQIAENVQQLAADLLTTAESLKSLIQRQSEQVTELGVSSMKLKEIEGDPAEIGELMIDATTIIANWDVLVQYDVDLLVQSLSVALPTSRKEALSRLSAGMLDEWLNDLVEARSSKPIDLEATGE